MNRLNKLKKLLKKEKLNALLVSTIANITYLTGFNGFSKDEREAFLLITQGRQYLLTDGRYIEAVQKTVKDFEIKEMTPNNPFRKKLRAFIKKHRIKRLGIEEKNLTIYEMKDYFLHYDDIYHYSRIVEELRATKNGQEIKAIGKACRLGDKTFNYILGKIKPGITEKQLAFEIEFFIKKDGADISFPPIVAFEANSSIPHHQTSNQSLEVSNQLILIDFGVKLNNYCSDMTRTIFLGKATGEQKKIYNTVLTAQQKAIDFLTKLTKVSPSLRCNLNARQVDKVARDYIIKVGFPTIPHGLGHGVGLEVHELPHLSPKSKDRLKVGMVFSIEPGIYIPRLGGVRIEDLVVLEKSGPRVLTKASKKIIEL